MTAPTLSPDVFDADQIARNRGLRELVEADRCDRCGSRAYVRVLLPAGGELLFCAHDARHHIPVWREQQLPFQDRRHLLVAAVAAFSDR